MRKLAVALGVAAAVLLAGSFAWKAEALTWNSAPASLPGVVKNYSPVEKTGCRVRGWCGWGRYRVCGRWRCWCVRCW